MRHRPIGIGVQGLADTYALMRFPFESKEAAQLNRDIFEAVYYGAVEASTELAERDGHYQSFPGSPASKGELQFDMWGVKPEQQSGRFNWTAMKARIMTSGMRNSLLLAPMPTASTAQILGNNESTEPFTSNMYVRRVLSGDFPVVNRHLMRDLIERNLWNEAVRMQILHFKGSIAHVAGIPEDLKELYKTVWEIKQRCILEQAAERGAYICQSQSLNIHMAEPTPAKLTSMHFCAWKLGLKTGECCCSLSLHRLSTSRFPLPLASPVQGALCTMLFTELRKHQSTHTHTPVPFLTSLQACTTCAPAPR